MASASARPHLLLPASQRALLSCGAETQRKPGLRGLQPARRSQLALLQPLLPRTRLPSCLALAQQPLLPPLPRLSWPLRLGLEPSQQLLQELQLPLPSLLAKVSLLLPVRELRLLPLLTLARPSPLPSLLLRPQPVPLR